MKKELRRQILAARKAMSATDVETKSRAIARKALNLAAYRQAKVVMIYLAFRNEVATEQIITAALASGKRVVIPVCERSQVQIIPAELKNYPGDLQEGTWGILEPKPEAFYPLDPREIDIVFVPGVAFDEQGNRLGYGAGYYDRFLGRLRPQAVAVALAYEMQILPQVYAEGHDVPVDLVITEQRTLITSANKKGGCQ